MTIQLNTTIDRPITDARHFTSVLKATPAVKNAWTLIKSKSYADPAGGTNMPARKGDIALKSDIPISNWQTRGSFEVPLFPGNPVRFFKANIPSPGNVFSIVEICRPDEGFAESWSLKWGGLELWALPNRNNKVAVLVPGQSATHTVVAPALGTWQIIIYVINMSNATASASVNGGAFTTPAALAGMSAQTTATVGLTVGAAAGNQPLAGLISDFAVVAGDISTMPDLVARYVEYFTTAYGA